MKIENICFLIKRVLENLPGAYEMNIIQSNTASEEGELFLYKRRRRSRRNMLTIGFYDSRQDAGMYALLQ